MAHCRGTGRRGSGGIGGVCTISAARESGVVSGSFFDSGRGKWWCPLAPPPPLQVAGENAAAGERPREAEEEGVYHLAGDEEESRLAIKEATPTPSAHGAVIPVSSFAAAASASPAPSEKLSRPPTEPPLDHRQSSRPPKNVAIRDGDTKREEGFEDLGLAAVVAGVNAEGSHTAVGAIGVEATARAPGSWGRKGPGGGVIHRRNACGTRPREREGGTTKTTG